MSHSYTQRCKVVIMSNGMWVPNVPEEETSDWMGGLEHSVVRAPQNLCPFFVRVCASVRSFKTPHANPGSLYRCGKSA